jgi:hypothetical protein
MRLLATFLVGVSPFDPHPTAAARHAIMNS